MSYTSFFPKIYSIFKLIVTDKSNKNQILYRIFLATLWQIYKRVIRLPIIIRLDNNALYIADPEAGNSVGVICTNIYESEYITFLRKNINKKGVFFDIGAHTGLYTLLLDQHYTRAISLEPDPETFSLLSRNIAINNLHNVEMVCGAASDHPGYGSLKRTGKYSGTTGLIQDDLGIDDSIITVPLLTIDDLSISNRIDKVSLIKIDTEGHELSVLRGAIGTLKQNPQALVLYENSNFPSIKTLFDEIEWVIFCVDINGQIIFDPKHLLVAYNLFACSKQNMIWKDSIQSSLT